MNVETAAARYRDHGMPLVFSGRRNKKGALEGITTGPFGAAAGFTDFSGVKDKRCVRIRRDRDSLWFVVTPIGHRLCQAR